MGILDKREKDFQARVNDTQINVQGLSVSFSSFFPLEAAEPTKLARSFELARRVITTAEQTVSVLTAQSLNPQGDGYLELKKAFADALSWHFKLSGMIHLGPSSCAVKPQELETWADDVKAIGHNMSKMKDGMLGNVRISDLKSMYIKEFGTSTDTSSKPSEFIEFIKTQGEETNNDMVKEIREIQDRNQHLGRVRILKEPRKRILSAKIEKTWKNDLTFLIDPVQKSGIHIEFDLLKTHTLLFIAYAILHEASHKFCCTRDFAYAGNAGYEVLSKPQALLNADSYGLLAVSLSKSHFFKYRQELQSTSVPGLDLNR